MSEDKEQIKISLTLSGTIKAGENEEHQFKSSITLDLAEGVHGSELEELISRVLTQTMDKAMWRGGIR